MRIGVNAVPMRVSGGGARFVFTELFEHLLELDRENEYVIFTHFLGLGVINRLTRVHPHLCPDVPASRRVRVVEVAREEDIFQHRDAFDVFFGPLNNLQPRIYDRPSVAILHDIQEQFFPEYFNESDLAARREIYPEICRCATTLVTISEFCKRSIVEKFGIDPAKIEVIYNAPQSGLIAREDGDNGLWRREPLQPGFLFYPANCYAHKNHELLLDALVIIRNETGSCPPIVFTGFELPGGFALRDEIEKRGLRDVCRVFNELAVDELRWLYRHALALAMPTRFEGFGMPVVEALACRCPVLCSDLPVLREVLGEAALFFDPTRVEQLVERIAEIARNGDARDRLVREGQAVARKYSWEAAAKRYLEVLQDSPRRFYALDSPTKTRSDSAAARIGVLITAPRGGNGVPEALKSVMATGYAHAVARVVLDEKQDNGQVRTFLEQAEVGHDVVSLKQGSEWERLRQFAEKERLDLFVALVAGQGELLPSALHSLAKAYAEDPDKALYLGEAWESENGAIERSARLRQLGDGMWKLEGGIYPEMMAFGCRGLAAWPEADQLARAGDAEWRWNLLKEAKASGRLCLLKRTLANCDASSVSVLGRFRAARAGVHAVHEGNGNVKRGGWLSGMKPILRPLSRVLPGVLRDKGRRIWRHLTHET